MVLIVDSLLSTIQASATHNSFALSMGEVYLFSSRAASLVSRVSRRALPSLF